MGIRPLYVRVMRLARAGLARNGALDRMAASRRPVVRHLRTLFALYDARDLASLDLPWWTYRAIDEVERFLASRPGARVFEYGSGASTVWLARRADRVESVEHDLRFAAEVRDLVDGLDNVVLHEVPATTTEAQAVVRSGRHGQTDLDFGAYVRAIDRVGGRFDLVVIDGRARVACLHHALDHLAEDGLVVFDDVRRRRYRTVMELDDVEIRVLTGAKPCLPYRDATALLRRRRTRA